MVYRPDRDGSHRGAFERNKKKIYATQTVCGICGKPVDFGLKYPHPLSPCIDHIIPIAKGGHPSDINNLQLAHWTCNRQKSDKLIKRRDKEKDEVISNRVLPHTFDWKNIRRSKQEIRGHTTPIHGHGRTSRRHCEKKHTLKERKLIWQITEG